MKINFEFQFSMRKNFFLQTCRAIKIIPGIIWQVTIFAWWHCSQTTRFDINTAECGLCINIRYINNLINSNKLRIMVRASSILKLPWTELTWEWGLLVENHLHVLSSKYCNMIQTATGHQVFPQNLDTEVVNVQNQKLKSYFISYYLMYIIIKYQQHIYLIGIGKICFTQL